MTAGRCKQCQCVCVCVSELVAVMTCLSDSVHLVTDDDVFTVVFISHMTTCLPLNESHHAISLSVSTAINS